MWDSVQVLSVAGLDTYRHAIFGGGPDAMARPKSDFLHIRLSPEDKQRVLRVARASYLDGSTWARQVIMRAVERFETRQGPEEKSDSL